MRRTRNEKGITLIALIVTIIVLIVIAGISIATLTSDNGVLRQVNTAKVTQIEATAREQMDLACSAMRLAIAEASARDNSYKANENAEKIQDVLLNTVKADSTELESESWKEGTLDAAAGTFTITYEGDDYKNACNDDNAKITYTITLAQRTIEVTDVATGIKGADGSDISIDIGGSTDSDSENGETGGSGSGNGETGGSSSGNGETGDSGSGSTSSEFDILAEQTLNFSENSMFEMYAADFEWESILALNQTYVVEWDGQKYYCYTRNIEWRNDLDSFSITFNNAMGNASILDRYNMYAAFGLSGEGSNMLTDDDAEMECPFLMGSYQDDKFYILSEDTSQTHKVRIYLEITE